MIGFARGSNVPHQLIGKWQWIESSGGFAGQITNPKTENFELQVDFTKKGIYNEWKDNKLVHCYKFSITMGNSMLSSGPTSIISYKSKADPKANIISDSFEFKGKDTLILKNECHDCYTRVFVRKK